MLKLYIDDRLGGKRRYYVAENPDHYMLIPDTIRKCVIFVCYDDKKDATRKLAGTAYFVSVPAREIDGHFIYVVTARHILANIMENGTNQKVWLRINKLDGSIEDVETDYLSWKNHPDDVEGVDVAILEFAPSREKFDFMAIPIEMATTSQILNDEQIGVGDEVFFTGLFSMHTGRNKNVPVVRVGNIALMPDEKERINVHKIGDVIAYLIEARSIGGLSGSPVFVHMGPIRPKLSGYSIPSKQLFYWLGMVQAHFDAKLNSPDMLDILLVNRHLPATGMKVGKRAKEWLK